MSDLLITIDNLKIKICKHVYFPSDDSYLLYDTVKKLNFKGKRIAEIGSGTGLITLLLAHSNFVIASDVSFIAAKCTLENLKLNNLDSTVDVICCNILSPLRNGELFDYIIFNPPYIPTNNINEEDISWSGGREGIEVTIKYIDNAVKKIKKNGKVICILSSIMNLATLKNYIINLGLKITFLAEKRFFFETIYVAILEKHRKNSKINLRRYSISPANEESYAN